MPGGVPVLGGTGPGRGSCDAFNAYRFQRGTISLTVDEEWKTRLKPAHRRLVSIFTFPLLLRYGYLWPARSRQ